MSVKYISYFNIISNIFMFRVSVGVSAQRMSSCPASPCGYHPVPVPVVVNQPSSQLVGATGCSSTKKAVVSPHSTDGRRALPDRCHEGLVCARCGRCHCAYCTGADRPLPACWMCNGRCECSARTAVDYCTCLWVVRTIFYHSLYHEDDDVDIVAEPFACCEAPHCCLRWSIIGALLPCLPCLICYCPLGCIVHTCEACHSACVGRHGCHCSASERGASSTSDATASTSSGTATGRSLINESESA